MTIEQAREVLTIEAEGILAVRDQVGPDFDKAIDMIMNCPSRVILTGIGKSGIIGQKIAATLNSTGTASFFLHPVEAMHGDLGIVDARDVVLAISYSGETAELNLLVNSLKNRAVKIVAMTGDPESTLAKLADSVLNVAVPKEACPLGLAPTASTTAALAVGDALAVVLLDRKKFKECDFRRNHPGGSLGERLKVSVSEVMFTGEHIPMVRENTPLRQAIVILNAKNLGAVLIVDEEQRVTGIITDGDIRRMVAKEVNLDTQYAVDHMTPAPKTISKERLSADALSIMQQHEITILPITDSQGHLTGILHLHDLLGKGEFRFMV
ncbi:MAG: KpsF/GutQ family sugar-phosphate isomerase [Deltaproteobacteria bacterium]|jgi:arabinose-5-phosphate isomerase|nr:KpsF/GutQ family sugar-phosphate isomerase [Deltaproteobacteria bacterium]